MIALFTHSIVGYQLASHADVLGIVNDHRKYTEIKVWKWHSGRNVNDVCDIGAVLYQLIN